jgi:hypothetical protein
MVSPATCHPSFFRSHAVTELSTPPLIKTTTDRGPKDGEGDEKPVEGRMFIFSSGADWIEFLSRVV